jgi:hypothetical protein
MNVKFINSEGVQIYKSNKPTTFYKILDTEEERLFTEDEFYNGEFNGEGLSIFNIAYHVSIQHLYTTDDDDVFLAIDEHQQRHLFLGTKGDEWN